MTCPICRGALWVCEDHSAAAWTEGKAECGCGGAGLVCVCNPANRLPQGFVTVATVDPAEVETWAQ